MSETTENLVLEHLRHIRAKVDSIDSKVDLLTLRVNSLETAMVSIKYEIVYCADVDNRHQMAIDRLDKRLDRIESRLELMP